MQGESRQLQEPSSVEALLLATQSIELAWRLRVTAKELNCEGSVYMYQSCV